MVSSSTVAVGPNQADAFIPIATDLRLRRWVSKLFRALLAVQVNHQGYKYSVERLLALDEYTRATSFARVLFVCFGTPLPMIVFVLSQESLPLENPKDGWHVNFGFWIRTAILGAVISVTCTVQLKYFLGFAMSRCQLGQITICASLGFVVTPILLANYYVFPVPFMILIATGPTSIVLVGSFRAFVGRRVFAGILARRHELIRLVEFFAVQASLCFIYPAYQLLFNAAAGTNYEIPTILLLPVIKITIRNIIARTMEHVEDMIPESVVFAADFFNATYMVTFLQSTSSSTTAMVIVAIDFVQMVFTLIALRRRTSEILQQVQQTTGATNNILEEIGQLFRSPRIIEQLSKITFQRYSPILHQLSPADASLLVVGPGQSSHDEQQHFGSNRAVAAIVPLQNETHLKRDGIDDLRGPATLSMLLPKRRLEIIEKALMALFTSECVVLTEYLEAIVPIFYGIYLLVMVHLPSARYHIELTDITQQNVMATAQNVFLYALLELVSFIIFVTGMKHICNMQMLHHLAFVLETQMSVIQVKMIVWMLLTMSFRVVHFGIDFRFRFPWITEKE